MEDDIEKIRESAIVEIKEKVNKNPKYLHPMNKERQEDMKRFMFANGNDFTHWMQQVGIMKNPSDIHSDEYRKTIENAGCKTFKEYDDKLAQREGFENGAERDRDHNREYKHRIGKHLPREFNEECTAWFGEFTENLMIQTFEDPIKMPYGNPGFDWKCKNGDKIDNKGRCLRYDKRPGRSSSWIFQIEYNNIADWFILSAWDDRDSLTPLHVWAFRKDDMVRGRKFWRREGFGVTNTPEALKELEKWEVTDRLDKLKELCNTSSGKEIKTE